MARAIVLGRSILPARAISLVARRELQDAISDWRTMTLMGILCFILPLLALGSLNALAPRLNPEDPRAFILQTAPFMLLVVAFFPASFSLVFALESFVGEKERWSLEPLLCLPLSTEELYLGKLLGLACLPVATSNLALLFFVIGSNLWLAYPVSLELLVQVFLLTLLETLGMVAAAGVVSTHSNSVRSANLFASFIILPVMFLIQLEALELLWGRGDILWLIVPELTIVAIILVRLGIRVFDREELLSRAIGPPRLGSFFGMIARFWRAEPAEALNGGGNRTHKRGLWPVFAHHVPQLISMNRWPLVIVLGSFVAGLGIGYYFAQEYPLPEGALNRTFGADILLTPSPMLDPLAIFQHNAIVVVVMAFLSIFSFGAIALLVALMPGAVTGFVVGAAAHGGWQKAGLVATLIWPHGLVELPALFLASALCLSLGLSIMAPPKGSTLGENIALSFVNLSKTLLWVLPLFLIAAFIEAYITLPVATLLWKSS